MEELTTVEGDDPLFLRRCRIGLALASDLVAESLKRTRSIAFFVGLVVTGENIMNSNAHKSCDFGRIPKVSNDRHELLSAANTRETREMLQPFHDSFLLTSSKDTWKVTAVQLVNNPRLRQRFRDGKNAMKTEIAQSRFGSPAKSELRESHAFLVCQDAVAVCREGVKVTPSSCNLLGNSLMGVHMFRHADMCLEAHWRDMGSPLTCWTQLVICKVVPGRVKRVIPNDTGGFPLEPTPNCQCHMPIQCARPTDIVDEATQRSQVYIYEYDEENLPSNAPRQCLPVALLSVQRIYKSSPEKFAYSRKPTPVCGVVYANNATPSDDVIEQAVKAQREAKIASRESVNRVTQEDIDCLMDSIAGGDARQTAGKKQTTTAFDSGSDDTVKEATVSRAVRNNCGDDVNNRGGKSSEVCDSRIPISRSSINQVDHTVTVHRMPYQIQQIQGQLLITNSTKCRSTIELANCSAEVASGDAVDASNRGAKDVDQMLMEKLEQLEVNITENMAKLRELTTLRRRQPGGPVVGTEIIQAEEETNRKLHQALQGCLEHQANLIREFFPEQPSAVTTEGAADALSVTERDSESQIECALDDRLGATHNNHGGPNGDDTTPGLTTCPASKDRQIEANRTKDVVLKETREDNARTEFLDIIAHGSSTSTSMQHTSDDDVDEITQDNLNHGRDSSCLASKLFDRLDSRLTRLYRDYNSAFCAWCEMKGVRDLHVRAGVRMARADRQELSSQEAALAILHVDIERYARHLVASSRLLDNSGEDRPTSAWQRTELSAIDAHIQALGDTRPEVVTQLHERRRRLLSRVTLPRLPQDSPGNDHRQLMRMLRRPLKPAKRSYVEEKLATLLRNKEPEDVITVSSGDEES